jgi:hypothetical protein
MQFLPEEQGGIVLSFLKYPLEHKIQGGPGEEPPWYSRLPGSRQILNISLGAYKAAL